MRNLRTLLNENKAPIPGTILAVEGGRNPKKVKITTIEDLKDKELRDKIAAEIPGAITQSQTLALRVTVANLSDPSSEDAQNVNTLANILHVDANKIVEMANFVGANAPTDEVMSAINDDATAEWVEYISKWGPDVIASLQKLHIPLSSVPAAHQLSEANVDLIVAQNKKRVKLGFPEATYILSPEDWYRYFNREVTWEHCCPIRYYVPITNAYRSNREVQKKYHQYRQSVDPDRLKDNPENEIEGLFHDPNMAKFVQIQQEVDPTARGFQAYNYYDISDTRVIEGKPDIWNSTKRRGIVNQIFMTPTALTQQEQNGGSGEDEQEQARQTVMTALGDEDIEYAVSVYAALNLMFGKVPVIPKTEDGKINVGELKNSIFDLLVAYVDTISNEYANKDNDDYKNMANFIAAMYVSRHRIDNSRTVSALSGYSRKDIEAMANFVRVKFNTLSTVIKQQMNKFNTDIPTGHKAQVMAKQAKQSPMGLTGMNESYLPHGTYETAQGYDMTDPDAARCPEAEALCDRIFDLLGMSDVDTEHIDNGQQPLRESADDWFSDSDGDGYSYENTDPTNTVAKEGEFDNRIYTCCTPQTAEQVMAHGFHIDNKQANKSLYGPGVYFCTTLEHAKTLAPKFGGAILVAEIKVADLIDYKPWGESQMAIARSGDAVTPVEVIYPDDFNNEPLHESYRKSTNEQFYNLLERINRLS